ncbi:extracellular serine/threonine protein CG31145-like isoform X2 [Mercenaria mercenaria]|nr:extracellular serine/threonine protein CG31145-like isoform X2 [Mercenaria mercenaria]XP_045180394.1 extracellular serine/threonine protein CG31145-like isoform X2 [Mercenaria mercenaria]XP_045180395.1 extracellular serine/threonine protein CG31145-like isoform X2 [Mercenaria mercenaria]
MKHKARIVVASIIVFTTVVTILLLAELSSSDDDLRYYDTKLGSLQGHFEDALGLRKFSKRPDLSLKNIDDVKDHLYSNSRGDNSREKTLANLTVMFDETVERLLEKLELFSRFGYTKESLRETKFSEMVLKLGRRSRERSKLLLPLDTWKLSDKRTSNYYKFHHNVRAGALYDPLDPSIEGLLYDMETDEFDSIEMMERGTELKLLVRFRGGTKAVFKPMRWGRDYETLPNHFYFNDYERHNAEIAAFHLDRLLGFYRVPPVTGRLVNMTKEIFLLAERKLKKTFYVSPVGNLCFYGECSYYCDSRHSFCGNVDMIEGSLMVWLPEPPDGDRDRWKSPYRRSYSKLRKAVWESDDDYCRKLTKNPPYLYKRFIPDLIDSHVFDFLTGNMDRHHVEVFRHLRNKTCPVHLDNGRGFGKPNVDEFSIITPLRQCCQIRKSTFLKLAKLYTGPEKLSELLDDSMKSDPVYPILLQGHLNAVDRRVVHILRIVAECVDAAKSPDAVIINDGY